MEFDVSIVDAEARWVNNNKRCNSSFSIKNPSISIAILEKGATVGTVGAHILSGAVLARALK